MTATVLKQIEGTDGNDAGAIVPIEREIISRSPKAREHRGQQLANQFVKFVGEMVPLLIQVRQDFLEKSADETICGVRTFDEYCTGVLRYSRRRIQQLIQGSNPASEIHDGSAHRKPETKPAQEIKQLADAIPPIRNGKEFTPLSQYSAADIVETVTRFTDTLVNQRQLTPSDRKTVYLSVIREFQDILAEMAS